MMTLLHMPAVKAAPRLPAVPNVRARPAHVARPRMAMAWSVDPAGRLVARWQAEDDPAGADPLAVLPLLRHRRSRRPAYRRPQLTENRHGRRA